MPDIHFIYAVVEVLGRYGAESFPYALGCAYVHTLFTNLASWGF